MRLLFLSKRHPQARCLLQRPYGRFHHLPAEMAARGHAVSVLLVGHRGQAPTKLKRDGVEIETLDLRSEGPLTVWRRLRERSRQWRPDWIIGCSDIYYGIAAVRLAEDAGACSAIDSYDDFEAYMPWAWPLHRGWRRALRRADLQLAAGPQLANRLQALSGAPLARLLPMAADPVFRPMARREARTALGLPVDAPLFGYLGSIAPGRDVQTLWQAQPAIRAANPIATCLASGRQQLPVPDDVKHLGYLPDKQMPGLLASLDVAVITAEAGRFGLGSYPSKLYEAIACGIPMVCADLPNLRWIAGERARYYRPGDAGSLAAAVIAQLADPFPVTPLPRWPEIAGQLEGWLQDGSRERSSSR